MFKIFFFTTATIGIVSLLSACFNAKSTAVNPNNKNMNDSGTVQATAKTSFYALKVNSLDGKPVDLSQYKGKKIVLLNVASKCGYTPQYADWQKFYDANKEHVVVLGFPCNEFMSQEPGSTGEIAEFCQKNYGVTFPMFEKVNVKKGDTQAPVYSWLTDAKQNGWNEQEPSWNFCKYLISENGELTHFFASKIKPDSPEFLVALGL